MSVNIPDSVLRLAVKASVSVDIDLNKLGPIQRNKLHKMILTGVIEGESVPSMLASTIRSEHGLPQVSLGRYGRIKWRNITQGHELYDHIKASIVAAAISDTYQGSWRSHHLDGIKNAIKAQTAESDHYYLDKKYTGAIKKLDFGCTDTLKALVANMKSGAVTTQNISYS
jgi:hypothetical protein